ncbi:hypothetical protein [Rhizobium laguerreae]|uniref:hypothetical protein n=1 Tax=Rhizobium laguerreae TaxID=1076926 RepID=UPI001FEBEF80|nr:hypothetical protein [Rhizobium laguerreae]
MKWIGGLVLFVLMSVVATAQEAPRPQKVDDLVRLLQDPEVRAWLEKAPGPALTAVQQADSGLATWEAATRSRINGIVAAIPRIPGDVLWMSSGYRAVMNNGDVQRRD